MKTGLKTGPAATALMYLREDDAGVSDVGRTRLLDMTYARLVYSICATPLAGMPYWLWLRHGGLGVVGFGTLVCIYAVGAVWTLRRLRCYRRDMALLEPSVQLSRWRPVVYRMALLHGVGVGSTLVTVYFENPQAPFEYLLILLMTIAGAMAANTAHQTPLLGAFLRFFASGWGICCLALPWVFVRHWPLMLLLSLMYAVAICRHAVMAHRFFVQQIRLEDASSQLAEQYRQAKNEAERALQDKNRFLSVASHDLRQPMHAIGLLVESIAVRNHDERLVPALADLRQCTRSMNQMFNSLLDLSRIESGSVGVGLAPMGVNGVLDEVGKLFREEARSRGLGWRVHRAADDAAVLADAMLLRQSVINLVHNALRYTTRGGVLLAARSRGPDWRIEVWDTGMGVADHDRDQIHSPFYRPANAWRIDRVGLGLGLAVVARCAELMQATHGFESIEGRGSRFWISLPRAHLPIAGDAQARHAANGLAAQRLSGRCLFIDDDPQVRAASQTLLEAWGVDVRCVATATEAFACVAGGFVPQVILCDQRLRSGESGLEVLKALLDRCPDASGAIVSGEHGVPALLQAEDEGYIVLRKPLEGALLHTLLKNWLAPEARAAARTTAHRDSELA
jgi:signal transduction histidine kinase/CheY-like chemotaxis protein